MTELHLTIHLLCDVRGVENLYCIEFYLQNDLHLVHQKAYQTLALILLCLELLLIQ